MAEKKEEMCVSFFTFHSFRHPLLDTLEIVPITHSKALPTLIAESSGYTEPVQTGNNWTFAPDHWVDRANEDGWGYLMARTEPAPLVCRSRGKLLLLAAGPHALVICFALETSIIGMTLENYRRIVSNDIPGPNSDESKAEDLRTFLIPDDLVVDHSAKKKGPPRTIKIVAAFVTDDWVWTINDWTTLVRLYVFSKDITWNDDLISPGTQVSLSYVRLYSQLTSFFLVLGSSFQSLQWGAGLDFGEGFGHKTPS